MSVKEARRHAPRLEGSGDAGCGGTDQVTPELVPRNLPHRGNYDKHARYRDGRVGNTRLVETIEQTDGTGSWGRALRSEHVCLLAKTRPPEHPSPGRRRRARRAPGETGALPEIPL